MKNLVKILMTLAVIFTAINISSAKVHFSEKVGGTNGTNFMLPAERFDILSTEDITRIAIQHGRRIEQIEIEYTNRQNINQVESVGNEAGEWSYINLEEGEFITYITGRAGTLIDQITFHTSMRRTFGPYGGSGGQEFEISIPSNAKVIGFTGKVGPSIKQIGLIYRTYGEDNDETDNPGSQNNQEQEAPDVFENSSQSPIIQTAPIPATEKRVRDHRKNNQSSSITIDSTRGTKYTPTTKDYDIRQIFGMNGRGNQEPLVKGTTTSGKRKVRDHRNNEDSTLESSDSISITYANGIGALIQATLLKSQFANEEATVKVKEKPTSTEKKTQAHRNGIADNNYHPDSIRVMNYAMPGKEKDNRPFVEMNGRGNQEQEVKGSTTSSTKNVRDHRKKN